MPAPRRRRRGIRQSEAVSERASNGAIASAGAIVPASTGVTLGCTGQPLGFQVHVNSLASEQESGSGAQFPALPLKHQPQPSTGVQEAHVVWALHMLA